MEKFYANFVYESMYESSFNIFFQLILSYNNGIFGILLNNTQNIAWNSTIETSLK